MSFKAIFVDFPALQTEFWKITRVVAGAGQTKATT
jgi:hypothetical protein